MLFAEDESETLDALKMDLFIESHLPIQGFQQISSLSGHHCHVFVINSSMELDIG